MDVGFLIIGIAQKIAAAVITQYVFSLFDDFQRLAQLILRRVEFGQFYQPLAIGAFGIGNITHQFSGRPQSFFRGLVIIKTEFHFAQTPQNLSFTLVIFVNVIQFCRLAVTGAGFVIITPAPGVVPFLSRFGRNIHVFFSICNRHEKNSFALSPDIYYI